MQPGSILGHPVLRTEDPRFLTGAARYTEDVPAEGALHVAFVRSPLAHARLLRVDATEAAAMPGVVGVFTAADLPEVELAGASDDVPAAMRRPALADGTVRFAGEAVAAVVAETRAGALDAAETVFPDLDPLPVVVDPEAASGRGAPLLFPEVGTNVAVVHMFEPDPGALDGAEVVVRARFVNQRLAPVPMEPNGALAVPDPETGGVTVWAPSQGPHGVRNMIAEQLGLEPELVRVISTNVGGGFGAKAEAYPEQVVVAALARRLGRPVRYVETRSENLLAMVHGRGQVQEVELGATRGGVVTGLRVRLVADMGAYPVGDYLPRLTHLMAPGVYRIPRVDYEARCVVTNTTPLSAYRGAGRPEAAALIERAMDLLAGELGLDPVEVRRRNLIPADAFPFTTATGAVYDSGDYGRVLDAVLELAGYEGLRREQAERRARGDRRALGIGISSYVEITGWGNEFGSVVVHPDGTATARSGVMPQGQGHETAFAQIVAETVGIPMERVRVVVGDTAEVPWGNWTGGSRSLQVGVSAVARAGEEVAEKARQLAAFALEVNPEDLVRADDGGFAPVGVPGRGVSLGELAAMAEDPGRLPEGMAPGLGAEADFRMEGRTYPFGAHVAVVEVDLETGDARLVRHVAVDDCGRMVNPMLVDGQVQGGIAQGAAQALYEGVAYDEEGTPMTGTLMAYAMPSAADLPSFENAHTETPTPLNPLGAKGIGESATIGSTPAVQNAVVDALAHLGVRHLDMPLTPERVWRAIQDAAGRDVADAL